MSTWRFQRLPARPRTALFLFLFAGVLSAWNDLCAAQQDQLFDVTTYHYDFDANGVELKETQLSPNAIKAGSFGLLKTAILDEQVDAQPLVLSGLVIAGQAHDVVYVATENNTIYAIDASSGSILQQRNLGPPVSAGAGGVIECGNNSSRIGITSTPVIDRGAGALYLIAFTLENNQPVYRLHALDLITLADVVAPQVISASVSLADGSAYAFNAKVSRQRAALALSNDNKVIYAAFASFCYHDSNIARGWVIGWDAKTLLPIAPAVTDHRAGTATHYYLTSIWMSGYGPAIDSDGNVYFITGNSRPDTFTSLPSIEPALDLRESVVKVSGDLGQVIDFFTPMDMPALDLADNDFGSGGILLIPENTGRNRGWRWPPAR